MLIKWSPNACVSKGLGEYKYDFQRQPSLHPYAYHTHTHRRIVGLMTVPIYTSTIFPGAHLVTNEQGLPVYQGSAEATFTVCVTSPLHNRTTNHLMLLLHMAGPGSKQCGQWQCVPSKSSAVWTWAVWKPGGLITSLNLKDSFPDHHEKI